MNAVELLRQQHREVDQLFSRFDRSTKPDDKHKLFLDIAARLVAHDAIEREIFYPACERVLGKNERLMEGIAEHGLMEFSLFRADKARGKETFTSLVRVLAEMVKHHVEGEEEEILPEAMKKMGEDMLEELGSAMQKRADVLMKKDFRPSLRAHLQEVLAGRGVTPTRKRIAGAGARKRAAAPTARKRAAAPTARKRTASATGRGKKKAGGGSRSKRTARG
jgi:hemerythrin superfamily protein